MKKVTQYYLIKLFFLIFSVFMIVTVRILLECNLE